MEKPRIFLDMDGVLSNFVKGVAHRMGIDYMTLYKDLLNNDNVPQVLDMKAEDFWDQVDSYNFWYNLEPYNWCRYLHTRLDEVGVVYICTSPSMNPECAKAKVAWLQDKMFNKYYRKFIITPQKHLLANKNSILIDDSEKNTSRFFNEGGKFVLFPQPWNGLLMEEDRRKADYVIEMVNEITREL